MKIYSDNDRFDASEAERKYGYYDGYNGEGNVKLHYIGHSQLRPGELVGPVMSDHFIYHLVLSGCCTYRVNNLEWKVKSSEGFMVFPDRISCFEADAQDPCANYFVAFAGPGVPALVERAGLSAEEPIVHHTDMAQCRGLINAMIDHIQRNDDLSVIMIPALLHFFIGVLANDKLADAGRQIRMPPNTVNQYVRHAVHIIQNSVSAPLNIVEIAAQLGIDPSYFSRIFKKTFGTSPAVYIQNYRLAVAQGLLYRTSMSVKEIAYRVGFDDASYFTRCFTRHYGVTPSQSRQEQLPNKK
jgi:AraC-like DNA-binding protein